MAEVITFTNFRPPARFDEPTPLAWTEVRIEESSEEDGTYTLIDTIVLDPVEPDPTEPLSRDFTTELGTAPDYWYRIIFADASGDVSQATDPIQNTASSVDTVEEAYATASELAVQLNIRTTPTAAQTARMDEVLLAAAGEINSEIGRTAAGMENWQLALAAQVNIERAVEHWHARPVQFGIIGLDSEAPIRLGSNSWARHANKLAPLKAEWGLA